MIISLLFVIFITILSPSPAWGQVKVPEWEAGISSVGSLGDQAPFWIVSNRQGKFLPEKFAGSLQLGIYTSRDTSRIIDYDYGLEFYGRHAVTGGLWLQQAYAGITLFNKLRFQAGMREEIVGSTMPSISSGSVIWSGNARPVPKIELSTPGYIDIPFTRGYAEISGLISHGWFEDERFVSNVWLHHKNTYLRLGGSLPVTISFGFNHYAQWGGSSPVFEHPFPADFSSFIKVFLNRSADIEDPRTPEEWSINRFGNSLGSRNYGIDFGFDKLAAGIYQQDIFEDGSGMRKRNFPDGLWGIWIRFPEPGKHVQAVLYEFLQTTHQSGPFHDLDGVVLGGKDNYFNHGHYRSGWTYHGYTIGTPMITSPVLEKPAMFGIANNRVIAHHLGVEGQMTGNISYRSFLTLSRNFGTYDWPFARRRDQLSWMLEVNSPLNFYNLEYGIAFAVDSGEMYGNNYGLLFTLRKKGSFMREGGQ
jgi:hypothetical protein